MKRAGIDEAEVTLEMRAEAGKVEIGDPAATGGATGKTKTEAW